MLAENPELQRRLSESEDDFDARGLATQQHGDENQTIRQASQKDDASIINGYGNNESVPSVTRTSDTGITKFAFESILERSKVYRRTVRFTECDRSVASTAPRSYAKSVFSGYSLADISATSVIAMPLTMLDLANGGYYVAEPGDKSNLKPQEAEDSLGRTTPTAQTVDNSSLSFDFDDFGNTELMPLYPRDQPTRQPTAE